MFGLGLGFAEFSASVYRRICSDTGGCWNPTVAATFQPGEVTMLLAALAMAFGTVLIRFLSHSDPVATTGWHMLVGGLPLLFIAELQSGFQMPPWSAADWSRMAFASLLGSALAYGLFFWFASRRDLTSFSSLGFLTPVFALATGGWLLGDRLTSLQWIGGFDGADFSDLRQSERAFLAAERQA